MARRRLLFLTALALVACEPSSGGAAAAPPGAAASRELRIGSIDDSASALTTIREIAIGEDGRIYSLHPQENAVRIHDATGRLLRKVGREGSGPGEFRSAGRIGIRGDTLWVFDRAAYRFTLFDASGEYLGDRTVPVDVGDASSNPPRPRGMLSDGTIWGSPPTWSDEVADGKITHELDVRLDSMGLTTDTLIVYSIAGTTWRLFDPDAPRSVRSFREQPFSSGDMVVVSEHRPEIVIVERPIATDPARGEFRVTRRGLDGDTIFSVAFAYAPRPIPRELPDSLAAAFAQRPSGLPPSMAASWPAPGRAEQLAREALIVPACFPPVTGLVVGRDGTIWIRRENMGGETREWWVLDDTGRAVASVHLPASLNVLAADREHVWGEERDDLDVSYLVRYRIQPT